MSERRQSRLAVLAIALLTAAISFGACGGEEEQAPDPGLELVIGNLVPLSGPLEPFGAPGRKSAELASTVIANAIEETGGSSSVRIEHADDGGGADAELAVANARDLVADGAGCLVGAWATTDTLAVAEQVAIPEGVPLVSPAASGEELSELDDGGLVFRVAAPDSAQGRALAEALAAEVEPAWNIVNIAARDDRYGDAIVATFREEWGEMNGRLGEVVRYEPDSLDPAKVAERLVSGSPAATVLVEFPETFAELLPALQAEGWAPQTAWAGDGLAAGGLPGSIDGAAIEGLRGTVPGVPESDAATVSFLRRYESAKPRRVESQTFDAHAFDATILCFLAAFAAESGADGDTADRVAAVSGPPGETYSWEQLPEALTALADGREIDYQGASGSVDLDGSGDPSSGTFDIYRYAGGELEIVDEVPWSDR